MKSRRSSQPKFATRAIHAGQQADPTTGAVITPIYQTSTYAQEGWARQGLRVRAHAQPDARGARRLAALEGGRTGCVSPPASRRPHAILSLLKPGDHVVAGDDLYGGTYRLFERVIDVGLEFTYVRAPPSPRWSSVPPERRAWCSSRRRPIR